MSAQLLICEFAVFTCVSFFSTDASCDSHGSQFVKKPLLTLLMWNLSSLFLVGPKIREMSPTTKDKIREDVQDAMADKEEGNL